MAEIRVERRRTSVWPWIIGLIALALLIWLIAEVTGDDRDDAAVESSAAVELRIEPEAAAVESQPRMLTGIQPAVLLSEPQLEVSHVFPRA